MVVEIKYLDKPKFALGAKFNPATQGAFSGRRPGTDAAVINISPSGSAKGEKAGRSIGPSVFSQFTSQLKEITSHIRDLDKALEGIATGTAAHTALEKERAGLEQEFQRITGPQDANGKDSTFSNLLAFLDSATNSFTQAITGAALDQATTLFGNDGAAFLQRGGATAAQEIADALRGVAADGAAISDPTTASKIDDTLARIGQLFNGEIFENSASNGSRGTISSGPSSKPIELQEINFAAAGQLSLGLRSASPEDLMRAATSGIDINTVNHLLLKPESLDPKNEKKRQLADESVVELAKQDAQAEETHAN